MWLQLVLSWMLMVSGISSGEQVEIFDTDRGKVVETYTNTEEIQRAAHTILESVSGKVMELSPSLEHAMIVKIPMEPAHRLAVKKADIDEMIVRMFIIMPKSETRPPFMILHTQKGETVVVEFTAKLETLQKLLKKE